MLNYIKGKRNGTEKEIHM